jgi:hypothetical protein
VVVTVAGPLESAVMDDVDQPGGEVRRSLAALARHTAALLDSGEVPGYAQAALVGQLRAVLLALSEIKWIPEVPNKLEQLREQAERRRRLVRLMVDMENDHHDPDDDDEDLGPA